MKKFILLAASALVLTACTSEDNYMDDPVAANISVTIGEPSSRALDSSWAEGDAIGITMSGRYWNVKYTTDNGKDFLGDILYFKNKQEPVTITAYYPYTTAEGEQPAPVISASTSSEYHTPEEQAKINFLFAKEENVTGSNPDVDLLFTHRMSKLTFTFIDGEPVYDKNGNKLADGVEVKKMDHYKINDLALEGTFDTRTGVCAINPNAPKEGLTMSVKGLVTNNIPLDPVYLFPQTLKNGKVLLDIYTDELDNTGALQHYTCYLSFDQGEIKPGNHYKYTIKVTKIGLIVGEMTIDPWVETDRFIISTIDGDNPFKEQ